MLAAHGAQLDGGAQSLVFHLAHVLLKNEKVISPVSGFV